MILSMFASFLLMMMTWASSLASASSSSSSSDSAPASAAVIADVYVPEECLQIASPLDHVLVEFNLKVGDRLFGPAVKAPHQLFHFVLDPKEDSVVFRGIKGMCLNGTRWLTWRSGANLDLSPLPFTASELEELDESIQLEVSVRFITTPTDYQVFNLYKMGNMSEVMSLVNENVGVNAVDEWGNSLLMLAVQDAYLPIVASLLNARKPKVNVNMAKSNGYNALFYSISLPATTILKALLRRGANPNAVILQEGSEGNTPLHFACSLEKSKHAELLLEYGAEPFIENTHGQTPLNLIPRDTVKSTKLYFKRIFEDAYNKLQQEKSQQKASSDL